MIEFAYAATSGAANPSGGGMSILMIVLMVAICSFVRRKRKKSRPRKCAALCRKATG